MNAVFIPSPFRGATFAALLLAFGFALCGSGLSQEVPPVRPPETEASGGESAGAPSPVAQGGEKTGTPAVDLPKAFPASRYRALTDKSPFAVATAAPEPPPPTENFATNWVLGGLSKSKTKDGTEEYVVIVRSRDLSTRLVLQGNKPSDDGVTVVSVEEAPVAAKSVVILRKGSETGRVEFDQAAVAASPAPAAPAPGQVSSSSKAPKPGATAAAAPPVPRPSIPRPGMGGTVPRPGASAVPAPVPAAPNGASGMQDARRRVRPIPATPGSASENP